MQFMSYNCGKCSKPPSYFLTPTPSSCNPPVIFKNFQPPQFGTFLEGLIPPAKVGGGVETLNSDSGICLCLDLMF